MNVAPPMPFAGIRRTNPGISAPDNSSSLITLLCALNVFVIFSRVPELLGVYFKSNIRIVFVVAALCLVGLLFQGGLTSGVRSFQGKMFILLTFWMLLASVFGIWIIGSLDLLVGIWLKSVLLFFLISGSVRTKNDLGILFAAMAFSAVFIVFQGIYFGTDDTERGAVTIAGGAGMTFSNANGLAMALGLGIPFLLFQVASSNSVFIRLASAMISLGGGILLLRTGSRGGMVALLLIFLLVFVHVSILQKAIMLLVLTLFGSLGVFLVPKAALERYVSMFGRLETIGARSADESSRQRIILLKESIYMTISHPLLGVGPGNFIVASAKSATERGQRETWLESHNSYTRVSSETGMLGLLLFAGILFTSLFRVRALGKRAFAAGDEYMGNAGFYTFVSLSAYSLLCLFDSNAFQFQLPMLSGVAVALLTVAERYQVMAGLNPTMVDRLHRSTTAPRRPLNPRKNNSVGSQSRLPNMQVYRDFPQPRIPRQL